MSVPEIILQDKRRQNLVRIAFIAILFTLPTAIYDIVLGLSGRTGAFFLAAMVLFLIVFVSVSIILTRRVENPRIGTWHLLTLLSISFVQSSALQSNVGAEMGTALLIIFLVVSIQTLPPKQIPRGALMGIAVSILTSLLVFYSPLPQEADPRIDIVTIWVARGATLSVLASALTQFRSMNISNKLLIAFLGTVVIISMTYNIVSTISTSSSMSTQVGRELESTAKSRGVAIGDYINGQINILETLALDENIRQAALAANAQNPTQESLQELDVQWRNLVASGEILSIIDSRLNNDMANNLRAFQAFSPEHIEIFITDKVGAIIATTNVTSDFYQADEQWWIVANQNGAGKVYIGHPSFDESLNAPSIPIAVPIYESGVGLVGILRSTITLEKLNNLLAEPIGKTGDVAIVFPGEQVLQLHNGELEYVEPLVLEQIGQIEQSGQYYLTTQYNNKQSIFTSSDVGTMTENNTINDLGWKVIVHQDEEEALAPVQNQVRVNSFISTLMAGIAALLSLVVSRRLAEPISNLTEVAKQVTEGNLSARAQDTSEDEIGTLSAAFNKMTEQIQGMLASLEERVTERTAELEKTSTKLATRAKQFETVAQLARTITSIQDLDILLPRITKLISQQFGYYHAGLFLLDDSNQYAVLVAANSEGGQRMLARKHRLKVEKTSIVGFVTSTGNPRIALDTGTDAVYFDNPDMPETRSEMALPLKIGKSIIGALDVQSKKQGAFIEDDVEVLSILADEVSIAIENSRLYEEMQRVLEDAQSAFGEFTQESWQKMSKSRKLIGYELSGSKIRSLKKPANNNRGVKIPIKLRDQIIATMNINMPNNKSLNQDEIDITEALAERVGVAIESATLLEETQKAAAKEQIIGDITGKIGASINLRNLLQTAVEELGQAIPGSEIVIELDPKQQRPIPGDLDEELA